MGTMRKNGYMKNQKGFTLIELVIAIALMAVLAAALLGAMGASSKAFVLTDERETAKNLGETQMEYLMRQSYSDAGNYVKMDTSTIPEYSPFVVDTPVAVRVTADNETVQMQKITITVRRNGREYILEDYKVSR